MKGSLVKVAVLGAGGYVGTKLTSALVNQGYAVIAYDTYWYGQNFKISSEKKSNLKLVMGDIRNESLLKESLQNVDALIHLACISNDPSFDMNPALGKSVNLDSFGPIVKIAKSLGIKRFIFASSSSVYGIKEENQVVESLSLEPLTDYSRFKAICEEILLSENCDNFVTTVLRPATVCGYSPRQRFDLAVNILTNHALNRGEITILGGTQFRPNLHIDDMVDAYLHILKQPSNLVSGEIFNVGGQNLTLNEIAKRVSEITSVANILVKETDDLRSYRLDSNYILKKTGFSPTRNIENAIKDLVEAFSRKLFDSPLDNPMYFNIKRMKELDLA
jgi:nucleoside-diphosphate-sugar epimerase